MTIVMALSPKQQRFIDEFCIDQNATQAYKRAGYKVTNEKSAKACGGRLYCNPIIRAEIDARLAILAVETRMTAKEAHREIACIARSDIGDIIDMTGPAPRLRPVNEIPETARRAIKSVKVKRYVEGAGENASEVELMEFTFWDKLAANIVVLRSHGELKEKVEHSGPGGAAIPLHHTGNVSNEPSLQAADAAYAESLADSVIDSVAPAEPNNEPDGGLHGDGGP